MKKSNAIKMLENQKTEFIDKSFSNVAAWKGKTASMIIDFLGFDSNEYYAFAKFNFGDWCLDKSSTNKNARYYHEHSALVGLIDNCIDKIKRNGLYRKPQSNILSSQTNERLIAIIFAISSVIFGIGYYFGTEKTNRDLIQTEIKYKNLKDSLSSVNPFVDTKSMTNEKK